MRCLHCNKKLSLLKLAKGDSFCSPEHFDAYQLQQSKDAFQRLMNLKDDDALKAPLVMKPKEETAAASEENLAMARLNALGPPLAAPLAAPLSSPVARVASINAPPYAPFASSPLPVYPQMLPSPIANGPEANVPVEAARELAFPVHDVASTAGLLNLYLQLSLSGAGPRNWESERSFTVAPEDFRITINPPAVTFATAFPEIEDLAPVEPAEAPVAETLPVIEPVEMAPAVDALPVEAGAVAETVPFNEMERADEPVELAPAIPVEAVPDAETVSAFVPVTAAEAPAVEALPVGAVPFAETVPPIVPEMPVEQVELAPAVETVQPVASPPIIEAAPVAESVPFNGPAVQAEQVSLASVPPLEFSRARLPYLIAPSFIERVGASTFVDGEASSVPTGATLDCLLGSSAPRAHSGNLSSNLEIPKSTLFAATRELPSRDSATQWTNWASELPILPAFVVPDARKHICEDAWSRSERRIGIARPAMEASWASTRALDFDLPAPASLVVRPAAPRLGVADPTRVPGVSTMDAAALNLDVLKTDTQGDEPQFVDPPASAMEPGWPATLAPFPGPKPFPGAWQYRTSHCSLPSQLATWTMAPMVPLESLAVEPECAKIAEIKMAALAAPYSATIEYRAVRWAEAECERAGMVGEAGLVFSGSPTLPRVLALPAGRFETRSGGPVLRWELSAMASKEAPPAKFLPVRDSAILPAATRWPRLESLPL